MPTATWKPIAGQVFVLGQAGYDQARQAWIWPWTSAPPLS